MWQAFPFKIFEKYFYELPISGFPEAMTFKWRIIKNLKKKTLLSSEIQRCCYWCGNSQNWDEILYMKYYWKTWKKKRCFAIRYQDLLIAGMKKGRFVKQSRLKYLKIV